MPTKEQIELTMKVHFNSWNNQNKDEWDYSNLALPKTKYFKKSQ